MAIPANVVRLHVDSPQGLIQTFLNSKGLNSVHTQRAYTKDIEVFFMFVRNKKINELTHEDLKIKNHEVEQFKTWLAKEFHGNTVNRKLSTISKLYEFFARNAVPGITKEIVKVDKVKAQTRSYGVLTPEEGYAMVELVKQQRKGEEKSILIHLAIATSLRLSSLLHLTWDNIIRHNDLWIVDTIDKGQQEQRRPISEELYLKLQSLKQAGNQKIFTLTQKTCDSMIKTLCKDMGIDDKRNITFHSLRKIAINYAIDVEKDIMLAARQAGHSNPSTTVDSYLKRHESLEDMPGLQMEKKVDYSVFESMSKEDLLSLIQASDLVTQRKLVKLAKKMNAQ